MSGAGAQYSPILVGERPSAPKELGHTLLKNTAPAGQALQMSINGTWISPKEAAEYRLFALNTSIGQGYRFTWHHNIPWNELRDSWNIIITFCTPKVIKRLFDLYTEGHVLAKTADSSPEKLLRKVLALRENAGPADRDDADAGRQNKSDRRTGQGWLDHLAAYRFPTRQSFTNFDSTDYDALRVFVCWHAWNVVEGPCTEARTDDPGELFDDFSVADRDTSHSHRYGCIARLHATLGEIVDEFNSHWAATACNYVSTTITWSRALDSALDVCEAMTADERKQIFYVREMWHPVYGTGPTTVIVDSKEYWKQAKRVRL